MVKKISDLINKMVCPIVKKKGFFEVELITKWDEIVGREFSEIATPRKISFDEKETTLYIEVTNGALGLQLIHDEELLIERITLICGYKFVSRLRILHQVGQ